MKTQLKGKNEASLTNIFDNRGINPDILFKMNESMLHDPFLLKNMKEAVDEVHSKITNGTGLIGIVQDPDADGYTSTMAIYDYLLRVFGEDFSSRAHVLVQDGKEHGIPINKLEEIAELGHIDIVIAPDCSSNEPDVHKVIKETFSTSIVVLDHHDAEYYSEDAIVVNPSLDDYPNKNISGVAVVQKFLHAFDIKHDHDLSKDYFDLVAVGMIGDMIEITTPETIYMVQQGMNNVRNEFLKALYKKQSYSMGEVTPIGISFYITPLINAVTRMGTYEEKLTITRAMLTQKPIEVQSLKRGEANNPEKTEIIQEQAVRIMTNIKSRQGREVDKALKILREQIKENNLLSHQVIVLDTDGKFPKTFTGLIANKFMREYNKPTIVGSYRGIELDKDVYKRVFAGSVRGDDKSELAELKSFINDSGLVDYAEGHEAAHGVQVPATNKDALVKYFDDKLEGIKFEPIHRLDFDLDKSAVPNSFLEELTRFSTFWARGFDEPVFKLNGIRVDKKDVSVTGSFDSHTLKFTSGGVQYIAFRQKTADVKAFVDNANNTVNVIGTASMNTYNGETNLQVMIDDFEIQKTQKFYF